MPGVKAGDFVRVKRGLYKGDLAQVIRTEPDRQRVIIKLLPRLDFNAYLQRKAEKQEQEHEDGAEGTNTKKRRFPFSNKGPAPPQLLFNGNALKARLGQAVWFLLSTNVFLLDY